LLAEEGETFLRDAWTQGRRGNVRFNSGLKEKKNTLASKVPQGGLTKKQFAPNDLMAVKEIKRGGSLNSVKGA